MFTSGASSFTLLVMMIVVLGGIGLYYVLVVRGPVGPAGETADLAAAGYAPGEALVGHGTGDLLFIDESDNLCGDVANAPQVGTALTTHDRLLVEADGQRRWFDAHAPPTIRRLGRIMTKNTTGVLDVLASRTETILYFVRTGAPTPEGAEPKRLYNAHGVREDVHVVELRARGCAPLRFEAVESVVVMLHQWAHGSAPISRAPQPFSSRAVLPRPQHTSLAFADTELWLQPPPSSHGFRPS